MSAIFEIIFEFISHLFTEYVSALREKSRVHRFCVDMFICLLFIGIACFFYWLFTRPWDSF
jgi:hypothetical protein